MKYNEDDLQNTSHFNFFTDKIKNVLLLSDANMHPTPRNCKINTFKKTLINRPI